MKHEISASEVQYDTLPAKYREEMRAYIERGERPGSFIQAVLDGNLYNAFNLSGHLPEEPHSDLAHVTGWVCGQCPVKAFGTISAVEGWISDRGLRGLEAKRRKQERDATIYKDRMLDIGGAENVKSFLGFIGAITGRRL